LTKFFSIAAYVKGIAWAFNWLKCLVGFLHLQPTAGCQISTLISGFSFGWGPLNIPWKIANRRQSPFSLGV
jgi:hypothetical protein